MDQAVWSKFSFTGANLDHVTRYVRAQELKGIAQTTIVNKLWRIYAFVKHREGKDLADVTQGGIEDYVLARKKIVSKHTLPNDIVQLRHFYQWFMPERAEELFHNIKPARPKPTMPIDQVMRATDVQKMLAVCSTQRDRALISLLWDSGARLGEVIALNVGSVQIDQYGAVISVDGKTGQRRIRLIDSVPDIQTWLNQHPKRTDPKAPLFINLRKPGGDVRWSARGIQNSLKTIAKHAGVEKRIYPHAFRHGRATDRASHYTEPEMRVKFGWTSGSMMPSTYVHLSGRDVEDKDLRLAGILTDDPSRNQNPLAPIDCPRCKRKNPPDAMFCNCGMTLREEAFKIVEEAEDRMEGKLSEDQKLMTDVLTELRALRKAGKIQTEISNF